MVIAYPLFLPTWSKLQWFRLGFQVVSEMSQIVLNFIFLSSMLLRAMARIDFNAKLTQQNKAYPGNN